MNIPGKMKLVLNKPYNSGIKQEILTLKQQWLKLQALKLGPTADIALTFSAVTTQEIEKEVLKLEIQACENVIEREGIENEAL